MAFLTGKKKGPGTYKGVKVPVTLSALLMLEAELVGGNLKGCMDFTCNIIARVYSKILGQHESDNMPQLRRRQWGKFLHELNIIPTPTEAILEGTLPKWVSALHKDGSLNEIRLALVRDILKEAHNHA